VIRDTTTMAERPDDRMPEPKMDPASLYREEIYTDRKVGLIRVLLPVKANGSPDSSRTAIYVGEAQIYTNMGALPLSFELEAASLEEAIAGYADAAKQAMEQAIREIQELRRQAASSIVIPQGGGFGGGGVGGPGGGLIGPGGSRIQR
jgi:hypothetical protein